jgi:hypothetical protein
MRTARVHTRALRRLGREPLTSQVALPSVWELYVIALGKQGEAMEIE